MKCIRGTLGTYVDSRTIVELCVSGRYVMIEVHVDPQMLMRICAFVHIGVTHHHVSWMQNEMYRLRHSMQSRRYA